MEDIVHLDRSAMLDELVPHRYLPDYDPAAYVIRANNESNATEKGVAVHTSYDLGVVFGRSLMAKAAKRAGALLPIIDDESSTAKRMAVDRYLQRSTRTPLQKLLRHDDKIHPDIPDAGEAFAQRCRVVLIDKVFRREDLESLRRGLHDYLSVIDILEAPDNERSHIRRRLGGVMLVGLFMGFGTLAHRK
jgi:hypothetical protein